MRKLVVRVVWWLSKDKGKDDDNKEHDKTNSGNEYKRNDNDKVNSKDNDNNVNESVGYRILYE